MSATYKSILGFKNNTNLTFETLNFFGGSSNSPEIALSVLEYLNQNAFRTCSLTGNKLKTKIIVVNQLGYSILGFNPPDGTPPPIPTVEQKIVSIQNYNTFTSNNNKTQLIGVFKTIMSQSIQSNNLYLVARQCKVMVDETKEELAGQWATQVNRMMLDEQVLRIRNPSLITRVIDLGGSSGTFYNRDENMFVKDKSIKEFMKSDELKPNQFENHVDTFVQKFNECYNSL